MNIQHPENKNRPAYPTRAGVAALAAVCLWGAVPQAQSAETPAPSVPASQTRYEHSRSADGDLYVRQQAEEEALLAPYADGKTPVPEAVQNQLQAMVRQYARERAAIWGDQIDGEVLEPGIRLLGVIALEPGENAALITGTLHQNQVQRVQLYRLLGKYAYTDEAMPKEKLVALKDLLLKQISERQELRAKYAPSGSEAKSTKSASPGE